jgi:phosphonate transport system substrate-binding protein
MITMRAAGIVPERDLQEIVDAGGHGGVVAAVYNGDVDAGATYVDARTTIEEDNPDVMEKVRIIETSVPIPNDGVQFHPDIPEELKTQIVEALLAIADTEEGRAALGRAYSWDGLVERGDEFYDPFRQVLQASGLELDEIEAD